MRLALLTLMLLGASAHAHKSSDSYLWLDQTGSGALTGRWDIAVVDLERLVGLDADVNGQITWGELRARADSVTARVFDSLTITAGERCQIVPGDISVDNHAGDLYASIAFSSRCSGGLDSLELDYSLLFDTDPGHRGLLRVTLDGGSGSAVLGPEDARWTAAAVRGRGSAGFSGFVREGIWHIWIGYDHIAFLVLLLLPSVLRRHGGRWMAAPDLRAVVLDMAKIVTAFTIAHSITLTVAALGIVTLPVRPVEMAIAASVVVAGLHNIVPVRLGPRWALAFGFGLIHGFGFASVLSELGKGQRLVAELLGFNLGVEIGQLAIAFALLPLIYVMRSTAVYRRALVPAGSLAVAALAGLWFVERAVG